MAPKRKALRKSAPGTYGSPKPATGKGDARAEGNATRKFLLNMANHVANPVRKEKSPEPEGGKLTRLQEKALRKSAPATGFVRDKEDNPSNEATQLAQATVKRDWKRFVAILKKKPDEASAYDSFSLLPLDWLFMGLAVDDVVEDKDYHSGSSAEESMSDDESNSGGANHYELDKASFQADLKGQLEAVVALLKYHPGQARDPDGRGRVALHRAVVWGGARSELVKKVLASNPSAASLKDDEGSLPLHLAILAGTAHIPGKPDEPGEYDQEDFPCFQAYELYEYPISSWFNHGDSDDEDDWNWHTNPKTWRYVYQSVLDVPSLLLEAYKAGARVPDSNGCLPLHYAALHRLDLVQILLDAYPDGKRHRDNKGRLPLHYALAFGAAGNAPALYRSATAALVVVKDDSLTTDVQTMHDGPVKEFKSVTEAVSSYLTTPDEDGYLPLQLPGTCGVRDCWTLRSFSTPYERHVEIVSGIFDDDFFEGLLVNVNVEDAKGSGRSKAKAAPPPPAGAGGSRKRMRR